MKKTIIRNLLGMGTIASLFLACSEADTIFNQLLWSGSWAFVCYFCGKGFAKYMTGAEKEERV